MPRGDRTGSMGQGPMTGRGLGYCSGFDSPGYTKGPGGGMSSGFGFGRGCGRGIGRGMAFGRGIGRGMAFGRGWNLSNNQAGTLQGFPWASSISKEDEVKLLKSQADALSRSQKDIEKRLGELEKEE